jgi:hypothetical protein
VSRRKVLIAIGVALASGITALVFFLPPPPTKFDQIRKGMTYDQVVSILGEPDTCVGPRNTGGYWRAVATWEGKNGSILITFHPETGGVHGRRLLEPPPPRGVLERMLGWLGWE